MTRLVLAFATGGFAYVFLGLAVESMLNESVPGEQRYQGVVVFGIIGLLAVYFTWRILHAQFRVWASVWSPPPRDPPR